MKASRLLLGGALLGALLGNGCVITSAQILTHFDLPNPFTINSSLVDHSERIPVDLATQYFLVNGRVDATNHRAAVLATSSTDLSDQVLPVNLQTGAIGQGLNVDVGSDFGGLFNSIDVDRASGRAIVAQAFFGDICIGGRFGSIASHGCASEAHICNCGLNRLGSSKLEAAMPWPVSLAPPKSREPHSGQNPR